MVYAINLRRLVFILLSVIFTLNVVYAQSGEELYSTKCAGCHTIGGGDLAGPDLLGVTERRDVKWLVRIIVEPDKLTAENDPIQKELIAKYGFQMPNLGLTEEEALKIIEYLKQFSAPSATSETPEGAPTTPEKPEKVPELGTAPELGRALFSGEKRFARGGPPCIACHSVSSAGIKGGSMAKDLSDLYARLGEKGVYGALKSLQFPVMKDVYAGKSLTDEEIAALAAFFKEAAGVQERGAAIYPMSGIAIFLFAVVLGTVYYWRVK